MERTITVKGTGNVSSRPDTIEISLTLESVRRDYEKAMTLATEKVNALTEALTEVGFKKEDIKTASFNVRVATKSSRDKNGDYRSVFVGYNCTQAIRLTFTLDTKLLGRVLSAIAGCISEPRLSVRFTVKDNEGLSDALLRSAAENARKKAEILASAAGAKIGRLLNINYSWGEIDVYSHSRYELENDCMAICDCKGMPDVDFEPEDINLSDTATFVWEIE